MRIALSADGDCTVNVVLSVDFIIELPNVRDHRHRTAGATSAGSGATKHSACQRVGLRWIAWFDLFLVCFLPRENPIVTVMVLALQNLFRKAKPIVMIYRDVV